MDRRPPGVATSVLNMRIITAGRTVVVPLSVVVLAVAGIGVPGRAPIRGRAGGNRRDRSHGVFAGEAVARVAPRPPTPTNG